MSLIKSISGIRGTIGGRVGQGLNPLDIVKFTAAYATLLDRDVSNRSEVVPGPSSKGDSPFDAVANHTIVVGRDARVSGEMVRRVVTGTLLGMGWNVLDIGLATTPTTEMAVILSGADGGIILTASHNPWMWNALKLLNRHGEFLDKVEGEEVLRLAEAEDFTFAPVDRLGQYRQDDSFNQRHIDAVVALPLVDVEAIRKAHLRVAIDCVDSVGGIILPPLLKKLGVDQITPLYCEPTGRFSHNPEPLECNLGDIMTLMAKGEHDVAFVVDPDVDRLAVICEDGRMYGEEYTLVTAADYVLSHTPGPTVSNLSSSRALRDVTQSYGQTYQASAVGEVNVTTLMRQIGAVIGGEGNGGVIYPALHYGRDALVGIALFLSHLAHKQMKVSQLRATYPTYFMAKKRVDLTPDTDVDAILERVKQVYNPGGTNDSIDINRASRGDVSRACNSDARRASHSDVNQSSCSDVNPTSRVERVTDIDGVKIDFADGWVHLRRSNTEPIIRVYSEARTPQEADRLATEVMRCLR